MSTDDEKLNAMILRWSVLAGVADVTPVIGADVAAVAGCQMKMFYDMAEHYGVSVTRERFTDLIGTLAAGVGGWAVTIFAASKLIKAVPGISTALLFWQPPLIAAFTWAMGQVLKTYFPLVKAGRSWDKAGMQQAMREAMQNAKRINWKRELKNSVKFG